MQREIQCEEHQRNVAYLKFNEKGEVSYECSICGVRKQRSLQDWIAAIEEIKNPSEFKIIYNWPPLDDTSLYEKMNQIMNLTSNHDQDLENKIDYEINQIQTILVNKINEFKKCLKIKIFNSTQKSIEQLYNEVSQRKELSKYVTEQNPEIQKLIQQKFLNKTENNQRFNEAIQKFKDGQKYDLKDLIDFKNNFIHQMNNLLNEQPNHDCQQLNQQIASLNPNLISNNKINILNIIQEERKAVDLKKQIILAQKQRIISLELKLKFDIRKQELNGFIQDFISTCNNRLQSIDFNFKNYQWESIESIRDGYFQLDSFQLDQNLFGFSSQKGKNTYFLTKASWTNSIQNCDYNDDQKRFQQMKKNLLQSQTSLQQDWWIKLTINELPFQYFIRQHNLESSSKIQDLLESNNKNVKSCLMSQNQKQQLTNLVMFIKEQIKIQEKYQNELKSIDEQIEKYHQKLENDL